jgi:hypothetical protein
MGQIIVEIGEGNRLADKVRNTARPHEQEFVIRQIVLLAIQVGGGDDFCRPGLRRQGVRANADKWTVGHGGAQ